MLLCWKVATGKTACCFSTAFKFFVSRFWFLICIFELIHDAETKEVGVGIIELSWLTPWGELGRILTGSWLLRNWLLWNQTLNHQRWGTAMPHKKFKYYRKQIYRIAKLKHRFFFYSYWLFFLVILIGESVPHLPPLTADHCIVRQGKYTIMSQRCRKAFIIHNDRKKYKTSNDKKIIL